MGSGIGRTGASRVSCAIVAVLLTLVPGVGRAAPDSEPKATQVNAKSAQRAKAIEALEKAYAAEARLEDLLAIAVAYDEWPGRCKEALAAFIRFLDACETCDDHSTAQRRYARARERCEVSLTVRSLPTDADVEVNEEPAGKTPLTLALPPGTHQVRIAKQGFRAESRDVRMASGRSQAVELVLEPIDPAPTAYRELEPPADSLRPWMWLSVATTGVGVALGTTFALLASDSADREAELREDPLPDPQALQDLDDEARARSTVAIAAFLAAGVGAASSFVFWYLEPDPPQREPSALTFSTDGRGAYISGRF